MSENSEKSQAPGTSQTEKNAQAGGGFPSFYGESAGSILKSMSASTSPPLTPNAILQLQRQIGNQAVQRLIKGRMTQQTATIQRATREELKADLVVRFVNQVGGAEAGSLGKVLTVPDSGAISVQVLDGAAKDSEVEAQPEDVENIEGQALDQIKNLRNLDPEALGKARGSGGVQQFAKLISAGLPLNDVISVLKQVANIRPPDESESMTTVVPESTKGNNPTTQHMKHTYELAKNGKKNLRVVRFVKAVKHITRFGSGDFKQTLSGYVAFGEAGKSTKKEQTDARKNQNGARADYVSKLTQKLDQAAWSYDGPHAENVADDKASMIKVVDSPGEAFGNFGLGLGVGDYPYLLATEFVLVIYDEEAGTIERVKEYKQCMALWSKGGDNSESTTPSGLT